MKYLGSLDGMTGYLRARLYLDSIQLSFTETT